MRIMHVCDTVGMARYAARARASERHFQRQPDCAHGALAHRSREGAILAHASSSWRCQDLRVPHILSLSDGANAFGCTEVADLNEAPKHYLPADGYVCAVQRPP